MNAATLGDWITWLTVILGTPAFIVWIVRGLDLSKLWRWVRIAYLTCYVAWEDWQERRPTVSHISDEPSSMPPSTALDGPSSAIRDETSGEVLHLTSVEIVRELARVKRIDSDGNTAWLSKERIAAVAGMRAVDARAIIDEVRGTDAPAKPQPGPQFEQVGPASYRRIEGT